MEPCVGFDEMIRRAAEMESEFYGVLEELKADPHNSTLDHEVTKAACKLNGYKDAIADMFGRSYDEVYVAVHDAYADLAEHC